MMFSLICAWINGCNKFFESKDVLVEHVFDITFLSETKLHKRFPPPQFAINVHISNLLRCDIRHSWSRDHGVEFMIVYVIVSHEKRVFIGVYKLLSVHIYYFIECYRRF